MHTIFRQRLGLLLALALAGCAAEITSIERTLANARVCAGAGYPQSSLDRCIDRELPPARGIRAETRVCSAQATCLGETVDVSALICWVEGGPGWRECEPGEAETIRQGRAPVSPRETSP